MTYDERIRRALDDVEIRNLICTVAQLADESPADDLSEYISSFTEDATWEFRPAPGVVPPDRARRGHADILEGAKQRRLAGTQGPGTHNRHVITTTQIKVSGDAATATSYMFWLKSAAAAPELAFLVVLTDTCRRTKNGWKLARRVVASG